jgi:hypothetical protein
MDMLKAWGTLSDMGTLQQRALSPDSVAASMQVCDALSLIFSTVGLCSTLPWSLLPEDTSSCSAPISAVLWLSTALFSQRDGWALDKDTACSCSTVRQGESIHQQAEGTS